MIIYFSSELNLKKSRNVVRARAIVRALNDAKTHAQQGCAMQFSGITLSSTQCFLVELIKLDFFSTDVYS